MKKVLLLLLFLSINAYSQKDSVVNFLDRKGNIVKKKKDADFFETIVKKDTVWQVKKYFRSGKIFTQGNYQNFNKTKPIGEFFYFSRKGKLSKRSVYNKDNLLEGKYSSWFENGKVNNIGLYKNNERIGVWRYYHFNGKIACKEYYDKGKVIKRIFYNEEGKKYSPTKIIKFEKPNYKGGTNAFQKRLRELHNNLDYQVVGKVHVNFNIDINGNIVDVTTSEKLPIKAVNQIKVFLENTKGWEPAIHLNRKIPYNYNVPLKFSVQFND